MHDDAARWNNRYASRRPGDPEMPKGLGGVELSRAGRCLDVACGMGEQSLWAAVAGYHVVALDASDVAISALNSAAMTAGVRHLVDSRVIDLDEGIPADVAGSCDLVICQRFRLPTLYRQLVYALAPGGVAVVTVLSEVGLDGEPGEFHAVPGELVLAFRDLDVRIERSVELDGEATVVVRRR